MPLKLRLHKVIFLFVTRSGHENERIIRIMALDWQRYIRPRGEGLHRFVPTPGAVSSFSLTSDMLQKIVYIVLGPHLQPDVHRGLSTQRLFRPRKLIPNLVYFDSP